jgi:hypothetical protein
MEIDSPGRDTVDPNAGNNGSSVNKTAPNAGKNGAHNTINEFRPKKRARLNDFWEDKDRYDMHVSQRESQRASLVSSLDEFRWYRNAVDIDDTKGLFRRVEPHTVADLFSAYEPSVLETSSDQVNWYAQDTKRKFNGYVMKGVSDRASAEALANTLLELSKEHNAPVYNVRVEFLSMKTANLHREELKASRAEMQASKELTPNSVGPQLKCANCEKSGHEAKDCVMPSPYHCSISP